MKQVQLGFEVGSGEPVSIPLNHMIVTGQTQRSGKTTTLEALIERSGCRAVAFVTKRFERSFTNARRIQPYFRQRADWQFVASILEATMREKYRYERPWIVRVSKGARTLDEVHDNIQKAMKKSREGGRSHDVYMMLNEYLSIVVPALGRVRWAGQVALEPGLNVMDLSIMPPELHSLVIGSVIEWVYSYEIDTVVVIPEAWEFLPQGRQSPVKLACEHLIRKGAGGGNYVWLDSQDVAALDVAIRKSAIVWLLGVQREANEVKRVLEHMAGSKTPKPKEVMTLRLGEFFAAWEDQLHRVYVQPAWMSEADARGIARGEKSIDRVARPAPPTPEEEPVSKELEAKIDLLIQTISGGRGIIPPPAATNETPRTPPDVVERHNIPFDQIYQEIKARLLQELPQEPALLRIIANRPELQVTVERQIVEVSEQSPEGRIGKLIAEGFFDSPVLPGDVLKEMLRRGWVAKKTPVVRASHACEKMAQKGFLTREDKAYKAAAGMKVNLVEK
jgi:hypothetical protein